MKTNDDTSLKRKMNEDADDLLTERVMENVQRGEYTFIGPKAERSAGYYDIVISHGYDGDMLYLAWDAAHKFGQMVVGPGIVSYRDGIVLGERAQEAAAYIDEKRKEIYASLPEFNRSKLLWSQMLEHYLYAEEYFNVSFKPM